MATLEGKRIVIIGGSSGIGYGVAKASLLSLADHVFIASSSLAKVDTAVQRLLAEPSLQGQANLANRISGDVVDLKDAQTIKDFFDKIGEVDHVVNTAGNLGNLEGEFKDMEADKLRDAFDDRFWGPVIVAQKARIRPGGSITLTTGTAILKPVKNWALRVGVAGSVDALARGLAIDLAPVRVNSVCPGAVDTELWDSLHVDKPKLLAHFATQLPVKHVAQPNEVAEAYLFLMKSDFVTGQRIVVDGGNVIT